MMFSAIHLGLTQWLIKLGGLLWLSYLLNYLLDYTPCSFRTWIEQRKPERRRKLVPEKALEQKYREGLLLLTERHSPDQLGDYLEFGVFQGTSLICMHRALKAVGFEHIRLFGFDSFEGLPDTAATEAGGVWRPGQYKSSYQFTRKILNTAGVDWNKTILVPGWFCDTLTDHLLRQYHLLKASVIMVDCDLYSSAKEALRFCARLIKDEALIFFDDWNSFGLAGQNLGEKRAFTEFLRENSCFRIEELDSYGYNDKIFLISREDI
jgi:predicted O-methyltransferase YrrM